MSAPERPATFTVTLTEDQRQSVLSALASELVDAKRYLFGPTPSPTPGPLDDCCDAHRARWQRDLETHRALKARHKHIKKTVKQFLYDGEQF